MTLAVLLIVLGLLAGLLFLALAFVWSTSKAAQSKAQAKPVAVTSPYRTALARAELARLGEVRGQAEARLREIGR